MGRVYLEEWCRKQGDYGIKLLSEWNQIRNGETTPFNTTFASNKKVWWTCLKCGYEWQAIIANRSKGKRGCPFCAGHIVIKGKNDFASIFPNIAKEWDDANDDKPSDYSAGSHKIVWWKCEKGHQWQSLPSRMIKGIGCPICSRSMHTSLPEYAVFWYLRKALSDVQWGTH